DRVGSSIHEDGARGVEQEDVARNRRMLFGPARHAAAVLVEEIALDDAFRTCRVDSAAGVVEDRATLDAHATAAIGNAAPRRAGDAAVFDHAVVGPGADVVVVVVANIAPRDREAGAFDVFHGNAGAPAGGDEAVFERNRCLAFRLDSAADAADDRAVGERYTA